MDAEVERIRSKLASGGFPLLLQSITIDGLRGFKKTRVQFNFPIVAIVGENGAGKTTLAKAAACAYEQAIPGVSTYQPGKFFMNTLWDEVKDVRLDYSYKHGEDPRQHSLTKPTSRWRGMPGRPKRHVYFFDISRTMPLDALMGYAQVAKRTVRESSSQALSDDFRKRLGHILNRDYDEARFAVSDASPERRVGVVSRSSLNYSQFHQGAGESSSLELLRMLEGIPDSSILIVDEVEASLHPKAQRRLVRLLLLLCRRKQIQIVLTTHSPYILEELPPEARILLLRSKGTDLQTVYGASTDFCLTSIDDIEHPELSIFCEDYESEACIREIIAAEAPEIIRRVQFHQVGPSNVVGVLDSLAKSGALPYPSLAVVDADVAESACLALPGSAAPEVDVFTDLRAAGWPDTVERFGIGFGELSAILEDAMRDPDHHKWPGIVGDSIRRSSSYVIDTLASIWAEHCLAVGARDSFVQAVRDKLR